MVLRIFKDKVKPSERTAVFINELEFCYANLASFGKASEFNKSGAQDRLAIAYFVIASGFSCAIEKRQLQRLLGNPLRLRRKSTWALIDEGSQRSIHVYFADHERG